MHLGVATTRTMSRKVIQIGGPGLGDSLSYSTLPEELTKQFGHEVWIGEPYQGWRNPEVRMLWQRNPHVKGFCREPSSDFKRLLLREPRSFKSWTEAMENEYGCSPSGRDCPKIYWTPEKREEWRYEIFADPTSSSQNFPPEIFELFTRKVSFQLGFSADDVVVIESPYSCQNGREALPENDRITVSGLDEYAVAIASCSIFLSVESGGHMFASAVKGANETPHVLSCFSIAQYNDFVFRCGNVEYKITRHVGGDKDWHDY